MDISVKPIKPVCGEREIIALLAAFMAMNAFALDAMLPALPQIGSDLGIGEENRRQLVIVAYTFGFGASQMFWGPIADRFGRKPVLALGLVLYSLFALVAGVAKDFTLLVIARFLMGASGAVSRVLVTAIVRDLYEGEAMARIMSLSFMVFMVVPVIAPSLGQLILFVAEWRTIFYALAAYGVIAFVWGMARLPETLHPEYRRRLDVRDIASGVAQSLRDRLSLGYTLALTAVFTGLIGYLASVQQIMEHVFERPEAIGWVFAAIAAPMSVAGWGNSRIVVRFGLRHVGHLGMIGFAGFSLAHLAWHLLVGESLISFIIFMGLTFTSFAFTTANFGTLAMTNMAPIAGTASSVQGMIGTVGAAIFGLAIGQSYDGTPLPFLLGMSIGGLIALLIVLIVERGTLFHDPRKAQSPA